MGVLGALAGLVKGGGGTGYKLLAGGATGAVAGGASTGDWTWGSIVGGGVGAVAGGLGGRRIVTAMEDYKSARAVDFGQKFTEAERENKRLDQLLEDKKIADGNNLSRRGKQKYGSKDQIDAESALATELGGSRTALEKKPYADIQADLDKLKTDAKPFKDKQLALEKSSKRYGLPLSQRIAPIAGGTAIGSLGLLSRFGGSGGGGNSAGERPGAQVDATTGYTPPMGWCGGKYAESALPFAPDTKNYGNVKAYTGSVAGPLLCPVKAGSSGAGAQAALDPEIMKLYVGEG